MTVEFDPKDGSLYLLLEALTQVEAEDPAEAEREVRALLQEAFPGCDFGEIPLFAVTAGGVTVLEEVLDALAPALAAGAQRYVTDLIEEAKGERYK